MVYPLLIENPLCTILEKGLGLDIFKRSEYKTEDKDYQLKIEKAVKEEYGLTRKKRESFKKFESRVHATISNKGISEKGMFERLSKNHGIISKDDEIKEVIEYYLGIKNHQVDSFEFEKDKSTNGFAYGENDGTPIVMTKKFNDNTDKIRSILINGLEDIIAEKKIKPEQESSPLSALLPDDNAFNTLHNNLQKELLKNEAYIKLHEGIHSIHFSNHRRGRRNNNLLPQNNKTIIAGLIPILNNLLLIKKYNFTVETEAFSHKIGFDTYMDDLIDKVIPTLRQRTDYSFEPEDIQLIKDDFHNCSTEFTKRRIKNSYLLQSKLYPAKIHAIIGITDAAIAAQLSDNTNFTKYIGIYFGLKAISHLMRGVLVSHYYKKADECADTLEILSKRDGNAKTAFYNSIGKGFKELHNEAREYSTNTAK